MGLNSEKRRSACPGLRAALILLSALAGANAAPLGAGITCQGELQVSSLPANGEFDFQFE